MTNPNPETDLRDLIAEALRPGSRDRSGHYPEGLLRDVDAVLAVLPPAVVRARVLHDAILSEVERRVLTEALDLAEEEMLARGDDEAEVEAVSSLRRLAAEPTANTKGLRALHVPDTNGECQHCHHSYDPCPTIAALDAVRPAVAEQPDTQEARHCTCADGGDCFVPLGHYTDCPANTQEADLAERLERGRSQLIEAMSGVSEERTCCGWASDWARTLHAEGGIWETLGRAVGWPTGNYDQWVWVSWDEAAAIYAEPAP